MANRHQRDLYSFLTDISGQFYSATQTNNGTYVITKNSQPKPLKHNPDNLLGTSLEFGTNKKYFSLNRSISYQFNFIKDGAAILRERYWLGKGIEEKLFFTVIQWSGTRNVYELSYTGKIDWQEKLDDPKQEMFTVSTIDDTAWGVLSQNSSVKYSIDCSPTNPKAIPVLIDGITLLNRYNFQTVGNVPLRHFVDPVTGIDNTYTVPIVLINQDGDSTGLIVKDQQFNDVQLVPEGWFVKAVFPMSNGNVSGEISFEWNSNTSDPLYNLNFSLRGGVVAYPLFAITNPVKGKIYKFSFNVALAPFNADDVLFLLMRVNGSVTADLAITLITTNIFFSTKTRPQPVIAWGLRPLDLLHELVAKATNNRFTINSIFFVEHNKDVALSGDSLRGVPDAKLYSSFDDFFKTFDAIYFMALRQILGGLWFEEATEVYKQDSTIIDLGTAIDFKTKPALDTYCNEVEVGSPDQDLRHPSGRLEFNTLNTFSIPIYTVNKKMEIVTVYRTGCYEITFLILDYKNGSTVDNSGDKKVYLVKITDEQATAIEDIETFENVNIDNATLEPIIKSPFNNDAITNGLPTIKGIAPPGSNVNIYVDTVLDGNTTADVNGNWSYNIVNPLTPYILGVTTGIHVIDATYTDLSAPVTTVTVTIDTSLVTPTQIIYPQVSQNLYNNRPLIKGVSQAGDNFDVLLDGVVIGNVTADGSGKWELQSPVMSNASHTIDANGDSVTFVVDSQVAYPLITYIGSELDGFILVNNLPLIKGVALPGTSVDLWLNYIPYKKLNTTPIIADANGDWSYQVIPVTYPDPVTGFAIVLAPIRNGLSIISTSLINHTVGIVVTGYKLSRPNYSSILGVIDNTVFNTEYSPKRMMEAHRPLFASIMSKLMLDKITFQTPAKNGDLITVLDDVTISERDDIFTSSLGSPLAILEDAEIKTVATKTFADTLYDFNNGGVVKVNFKGTDLYCLPIGSMKINNLTSEVQDWTLLMSPLTSYFALLNLYKEGLTITLNDKTMFHSDYNTLHFVTYNYIQPSKFNFKEIYDDWFNSRNDAWIMNPYYIQKLQTSEIFRDQIITRGLADIHLDMCKCSDARVIATFDYTPVMPAPIVPPEILNEVEIDLSLYPPDKYFFVLRVGAALVAISEKIETKVKWFNTILIESYSTKNKVGAFFSTGLRTILRVEGLVKKWQPALLDYIGTEEDGDSDILYAVNTRKRVIRFGDAYGLPDYLYLKVANALAMDMLLVEGIGYTLMPEEKIKSSDDVDGHPLYYYNVELTAKENQQGKVFTVPDENVEVVILNIDGTAFGLRPGTFVEISLDNE